MRIRCGVSYRIYVESRTPTLQSAIFEIAEQAGVVRRVGATPTDGGDGKRIYVVLGIGVAIVLNVDEQIVRAIGGRVERCC